jgi:hypothetical protein
MDWLIGLAFDIVRWTMLGLCAATMVRPRSRQTFFALMVQDPKMLPKKNEDDREQT